MLSGRSIDAPYTATRAAPHNGDAGRVADPPHGSERTYRIEPTESMHSVERPWAKTLTGQGFSEIPSYLVNLNVKASRRRYGAEQADPPTRAIDVEGAHPGEETAREDGQRRERSTDQERIGSR